MCINYILEDKHMKHRPRTWLFQHCRTLSMSGYCPYQKCPVLSGTFVIFGDFILRNYNSAHILGFFFGGVHSVSLD